MLEVGFFMLKSKGMTLIETLLAFSIFVGSVVMIFSSYVSALKRYQSNNHEYYEYLKLQNNKELELSKTYQLDSSIEEVLP